MVVVNADCAVRPTMYLSCEDVIAQFIIREGRLVSRIICVRSWVCYSTKLLEKEQPEGLLIWVVVKRPGSERLVWARNVGDEREREEREGELA